MLPWCNGQLQHTLLFLIVKEFTRPGIASGHQLHCLWLYVDNLFEIFVATCSNSIIHDSWNGDYFIPLNWAVLWVTWIFYTYTYWLNEWNNRCPFTIQHRCLSGQMVHIISTLMKSLLLKYFHMFVVIYNRTHNGS